VGGEMYGIRSNRMDWQVFDEDSRKGVVAEEVLSIRLLKVSIYTY
jgi:hypothetical protein